MDWLTGNWPQLAVVVGKAALMVVVAALGLRVAERRTLAQWSIIDFVTAVALGAVIGRTAVANSQSFLTGAVALVTLLVMHRLLSWARLAPGLRGLLTHRVRLLVRDGVIQSAQLSRCGLTRQDLEAHLRQKGVFDMAQLRYVLYESRGELTVVTREEGGAPLVRAAWPEKPDTSSQD